MWVLRIELEWSGMEQVSLPAEPSYAPTLNTVMGPGT